MTDAPGISVVITVLNGRRFLPRMLGAIEKQCAGRTHEILVVDDGSIDGSVRYLREREKAGALRLIHGSGRGHAAALNTGIREAQYALICQLDQDVVIQPGWLETLLDACALPDVAAAQGRYTTAPGAAFWAKVMGLDLEQRYDAITAPYVDHVCTGNTIYRANALHQIGLLDESFGYGADNDLSYRLRAAEYRLAFCPGARSIHLWRERFTDYMRQQFGVGYGRLDVIAKHPTRVGGDDVSGWSMILHAAGTLAALLLMTVQVGSAVAGASAQSAGLLAGVVIAALALERLAAGLSFWRKSRDPVALTFPTTHLARDLAWVWAIVCWTCRRLGGTPRAPGQGMRGRTARKPTPAPLTMFEPGSMLVLVPAHNEAENLPRVIRDIRRRLPEQEILVVDDGSTDDTAEILPQLRVRWLRLPFRTGVGGAIRAGITFAVHHGYRFVVRVDGDAQHRACDLPRMLAPVLAGRADVAVGSRYLHDRHVWRSAGLTKAALSFCLSTLLRRRVTDPTSGYWVFGPRVLKLLSRYHPGGYPEPELLLLLHRNGLRAEEVPIRIRPRLAGRTTLTWSRTGTAFARTLLALLIVPFRRIEQQVELARD